MRARIYQPSRNAMQSGMARTRHWVLEFAPKAARALDPLMGWTGSSDTQSQVRLRFDTQNEALDFARDHGIEAVALKSEPRQTNIRSGGYGGNFATNRRQVWTH